MESFCFKCSIHAKKAYNMFQFEKFFYSLVIITVISFLSSSISDTFAESNYDFSPSILDLNFEIEIITTGLNFPTKMTFIDEQNILVAQKNDGKVMLIQNFKLQKDPVLDLNVDTYQSRGLSGIESTNFDGKDLVFVYYTESTTEDDSFDLSLKNNNGNLLVKYDWDGSSLKNPVPILHPIHHSSKDHHGGATVISNEHLFLAVGDNYVNSFLTNNPQFKQQMLNKYCIKDLFGVFCLDYLVTSFWELISDDYSKSAIKDHGVIFRINFDGTSVQSNPFPNEEFSKYFAYGIRNSYGLAIDPVTKNLWDTENGPGGMDEVNLVFPGFNSGWKKIMGPSTNPSIENNLTLIKNSTYSDPKFSWESTVAPTAIEFLKSQKYGIDYENDVFVGDVHGRIYHFELNEDRDEFIFSDSKLNDLVANTEGEYNSILFGKNLGIITDIKTGPDGFLYVTSMVQGDVPGWSIYAPHQRQSDMEKKGEMLGMIFRIIPKS